MVSNEVISYYPSRVGIRLEIKLSPTSGMVVVPRRSFNQSI